MKKIIKKIFRKSLLYNLWNDFRSEISDFILDWKLPSQTKTEKRLANDLRKNIKALSSFSKTKIQTEKEWQKNRIELRNKIINHDPRNFLNWQIIKKTMFFSGKEEEFKYINDLPSQDQFVTAISKFSKNSPENYCDSKKPSSNLIHHAYSLAFFLKKFPLEIDQLNSIFEFGGGYGSLAHLFFCLEFAGQYTIFDLPEFSLLQEYYLSSISNMDANINKKVKNDPKTISLVSEINDDFKIIKHKPLDIFIGLWSFSEAPVNLRDKLFETLPMPKYFLIAYQEKFGDIDNVKYFKEFMLKNPQYNWRDLPIPHMQKQHYLFGQSL